MRSARYLLLLALPVVGLERFAEAQDKGKPPASCQDLVFLGNPSPLLIRLHVELDGQPLDRRWDECLDRIFRRLDTKGNGFLNAEEMKAVPPPEFFFSGGGASEPPWKTLRW